MSLSKGLCFDDLPKEMVVKIFSHLPVNQLLATETVNHKWSDCITLALGRVEMLVFENPLYWSFSDYKCRHFQKINLTRTLIINVQHEIPIIDYRKCRRINASKVDLMMPLLQRCQQIKSLSLDANKNIEFADINTLKKLINSLPNIECLNNGRFFIKNFNLNEWQLFCQEVGPRIKHLMINKLNNIERCSKIECLFASSSRLEFVHLTSNTKKIYNVESLSNRLHLLDLSLDCNGSHSWINQDNAVDPDTAAVISQAKNLQIAYFYLESVVKQCSTFANLKRLCVDYPPFECPTIRVKLWFPVLEHLTVYFDYHWSLETMISHLKMYNLSNLKSLSIDSTASDAVLNAVVDQLTLEKLVTRGYSKQSLGELLLRLEKLVDLHVTYFVKTASDLLKVVRLFKFVAQLRQLRRCRIDIQCTNFLDEIPEEFCQQLKREKAKLSRALPHAKINFPLKEWFREQYFH